MALWVRRAGTALLFVIVAALLALVCVPPFLDHIYYRGPHSYHFDGRRFFNPSEGPAGARREGPTVTRMARFLSGRERAPWPDHVAITPGYPPAAATPCAKLAPNVVREAWRRCVDRIDPARMFVTWVGHSTVLVQTQGLAILTDPIWSDYATPFPPLGPKRVRAPGIRFDDLPRIDLVLVSHDHYDHLDVATLRRLWARDRPLIVTSLGNAKLLREHGIPAVERDWGQRVPVRPGIDVIVEQVQHWSTRWGSDRNRALWSGFTVTLPGGNLFFAGDTGYGNGDWVARAARHGPFRLALLPIGAFLPRDIMAPSHMGPREAVRVFEQLGARQALAVHWGTFRLSAEAIDGPPRLLSRTLAEQGIAPGRFRAIEVGRPWEIAR